MSLFVLIIAACLFHQNIFFLCPTKPELMENFSLHQYFEHSGFFGWLRCKLCYINYFRSFVSNICWGKIWAKIHDFFKSINIPTTFYLKPWNLCFNFRGSSKNCGTKYRGLLNATDHCAWCLENAISNTKPFMTKPFHIISQKGQWHNFFFKNGKTRCLTWPPSFRKNLHTQWFRFGGCGPVLSTIFRSKCWIAWLCFSSCFDVSCTFDIHSFSHSISGIHSFCQKNWTEFVTSGWHRGRVWVRGWGPWDRGRKFWPPLSPYPASCSVSCCASPGFRPKRRVCDRVRGRVDGISIGMLSSVRVWLLFCIVFFCYVSCIGPNENLKLSPESIYRWLWSPLWARGPTQKEAKGPIMEGGEFNEGKRVKNRDLKWRLGPRISNVTGGWLRGGGVVYVPYCTLFVSFVGFEFLNWFKVFLFLDHDNNKANTFYQGVLTGTLLLKCKIQNSYPLLL